ncbi:hypothetical protein SAMN05421858_0581 [Haladaptatus litoreus]|uniref:Uncharacterized protein n=1 Tax=Haladaptatus litoreus TaxID=553468 RepID=A0A1N6W2X8_9EURY|nr:hypothetical protein [Haladaptatus litoreus]SIQ84410.1 hypothetical protein SAMN05421858_0581 [Haladaptatus litoreus]
MTNSALDERTGDDEPEIVFAIDETPDERCPDRAIIADITRDDVWLAVDLPNALTLADWW